MEANPFFDAKTDYNKDSEDNNGKDNHGEDNNNNNNKDINYDSKDSHGGRGGQG